MIRLLIVASVVAVFFAWRGRSQPPLVEESRTTKTAAVAPVVPIAPQPVVLPKAREAKAPPPLPVPDPEPLVDKEPVEVARVTDWRLLDLASPFRPSDGWPGWVCADIAGSPINSLWREESAADDSVLFHEGSCEEWERKMSH